MSAPLLPVETEHTAVLAKIGCATRGLMAVRPDGVERPLDECDWVALAPCGCISGITLADHRTALLRTEDEALRSLAGNAVDYREDKRNGSRMVLIHHVDYGEHILPVWRTHDCPHDPKYGVARKTREVGGIVWTRVDSTQWTAAVGDSRFRCEKLGRGWYLMSGGKDLRVPWLGDRIGDALKRGSEKVAEMAA